MSIFSELKRRNVFRAAAAYVAVAWVLMQVAEVTFPAFGLGDNILRLLIIVLAIGFIPVVALAWLYELTPTGLKRDSEVDRESEPAGRTNRLLDRAIGILAALALTYFAVDKFVLDPARDTEELAAATARGREAARTAANGERRENSIAVLAFRDLSADGNQEYFCDGIAEDLLNLLTHMPGLRVTSRKSAFSFKGKDVPIPAIADQLNVAHILDGSVRKAGDQLRIAVQLVDARTDTLLWSQTFDRTLEDIFAIQDEVTAQVARQLRLELLGAPPKANPVDPQAYAMYLHARQIMLQNNEVDYPKAVGLLDEALEIDPHYVDALLLLYLFQDGPEMQQTASRVHALDPDNAVLKAITAIEQWTNEGGLAAAARLLEEAAATDPYEPLVLFNSARLADALGKTDLAIRLGEYIAERDPLFFWAQLNLAGQYFVAGRIDDALARFALAKSLNASAGAVRWKSGLARLVAGDAEGALAEFEKEHNQVYRLHGLTLAYHDLGREQASRKALHELVEKERDVWPYGLARAYAWLGDADETFRYLEDKKARPDALQMGGLATHPMFRKMHGDTRWLPFLESIGQTPEQVAAFKFNVEPPG
jgi:adenylate cyclase